MIFFIWSLLCQYVFVCVSVSVWRERERESMCMWYDTCRTCVYIYWKPHSWHYTLVASTTRALKLPLPLLTPLPVSVSDLACFRVFLNTYCLLVCTGQGYRRQIKFSRECGGGNVWSSRQDSRDPPKTLVRDAAANWFFHNFHLDISRQFIREFISTFRGWCSHRL